MAICIPFLQPVPLWGLSTPLGLWLSYLGFLIARGESPVHGDLKLTKPSQNEQSEQHSQFALWHKQVSERLLKKLLSPLRKVQLKASQVLQLAAFLDSFNQKLIRWLKVGSKHVQTDATPSGPIKVTGAAISAAGLLLAAPLPVPFSNTFPAWLIVSAALLNLYPTHRTWLFFSGLALANLAFWGGLAGAVLLGSNWLLDR